MVFHISRPTLYSNLKCKNMEGFANFLNFSKLLQLLQLLQLTKKQKKVSPVLWDTLYVYIRQAIHCHRNCPLNSKSMIPNLTAAADPFVTAGGNSLHRVQLTLLTL